MKDKVDPITSFIGLGAVAMTLMMKYSSGTQSDFSRYLTPFTGTADWYRIKKEPQYVLLRGSHFLSIYNQTYYNKWEIGPMFYYSTIRAPIL